MENYPKPKLFQPSEKEIANAAQRLVKESCTENTAHSFTEAAEYTPENNPPKKNSLFNLFIDHLDVSMALSKLIELHEREAAGTETVTTEEWTAAIENGRKALENTIN